MNSTYRFILHPSAVILFFLLLAACLVLSCMDWSDDRDWRKEWTDSNTGLIWQVSSAGSLSWEEAKSHCENDNYGGHSNWRLPTIDELRTLIRGCSATETGGSCGVTDSCLDSSCQDNSCIECSSGEGSNGGCYGPSQLDNPCGWFWSSSAVADNDFYAWYVYFYNGYVNYSYVYRGYNARCVR